MKTDIAYLKEAYEAALELSTDPSTQNGAIIVSKEGEVLCRAGNKFPDGVERTEERLKRPQDGLYGGKYLYFSHAENGCICKAAKLGKQTDGTTMYCAWAACAVCARAIIDCGIKRLVTHKLVYHNNPRWLDEMKVSEQMFKEAGVEYILIEEKLGLRCRIGEKEVDV